MTKLNVLDEYSPKYDINALSSLSLVQLSSLKAEIESELDELIDYLANHQIDMNTSLLTKDGFPRNDINVVEIRLKRVKIIHLQNDLKRLLHELSTKIQEEFHGKQSANNNNTTTTNNNAVKGIPFLSISNIVPNSPSSNAGFNENDLIVKFGDLNASNYKSLQYLSEFITINKDDKIPVVIKRDNSLVTLTLTPSIWDGKGLLGCKLSPL